jgi:hypothetical protein
MPRLRNATPCDDGADFIGFFKNFAMPLFGGPSASILWE